MKARILIPAALVVLTAGPGLASAQAPGFKLFGAAAYVAPLSEEDVTINSIRNSIEASSELGWNVGFEARFNRLIGIEFDYVNATNDIEFAGNVIGEVHMQPLSATLNFHIIPTRIVDFYVGPTASYFIFDDARFSQGGSVETDNEVGFGASAGLEIRLTETMALLGGTRWLRVDLAPKGAPEIGVDPLISRLGVALRF